MRQPPITAAAAARVSATSGSAWKKKYTLAKASRHSGTRIISGARRGGTGAPRRYGGTGIASNPLLHARANKRCFSLN